ncbi:S-adenosyl methyltransferase [Murinocardiopsis flavida]|uniref:S-adenosyl methyltransferase n=1 Tax=Murinocardiopsis flavida TaxID=645275 RepID=A0A2P8DG87_9ACTN|nr:SAM-dependent methyltransferase [Murinocardiopsis flavida]PSK96231.1 S-adenosyl methyltransferase [Murinocardiopsis flavida]
MAENDAPAPAPFPPEIDVTVASVARMYDVALGGKDNFEADRAGAAALEELNPGTIALARANRAFLNRGVEFVARDLGITQFLDLGSGLPTAQNTHQIAQEFSPTSRVVYIDIDPIVLVHGRAILADNPFTSVDVADLTKVEEVLAAPNTRRLVDLDEPVCLMLVSLGHCLPDDQFTGLIDRYFENFAPGSALVYSHIVSDDPASAQAFTRRVLDTGAAWGRVRSPQEAEAALGGLEIVSPGLDGSEPARLVECSTWRNPGIAPASRPPEPETMIWEHAGVGVKPRG